MDGILNIYKEEDFTSHDVVAVLRGILKQRRIGHTGTLDPAATGVLPVCLGNATKAAGMLTDTDKAYRVLMRLGVETDTQDMTGRVIAERPVRCSEEDFRKAAASMLGEIDQIPPMYSAVKINGKRLYSLAREGKEVERPPRRIHIYDIEIHSFEGPLADMTVSCSKGTYIRTLCHDIGTLLGCGAAMEKLSRVRSGIFTIDKSLKLDHVRELAAQGRIMEAVTPVEALFADLPACLCLPQAGHILANGGRLFEKDLLWEDRAPENVPDSTAGGEAGSEQIPNDAILNRERILVRNPAGQFTAIYGYDPSEGCYKPVKMFLPG